MVYSGRLLEMVLSRAEYGGESGIRKHNETANKELLAHG
jgi:hypothetical protein